MGLRLYVKSLWGVVERVEDREGRGGRGWEGQGPFPLTGTSVSHGDGSCSDKVSEPLDEKKEVVRRGGTGEKK